MNIIVTGMHCKSCKMLIEDELEDLGATNVSITMNEEAQTGDVSFEHPDRDQVIKSIEELGEYTVQ